MMDIKICGLLQADHIDVAIDAGATHIGLVHFDKSPRHVTLEHAAALRNHAGERIKTVLLLVNASPEDTALAIDTVRPDIVQFHGSETPEWLSLVAKHMRVKIWKAIGLRNAETLHRTNQYAGIADRILFDAPAHKLPGGNGDAADWSLLKGFSPDYEWGLAGGLHPGNVAEAISHTGTQLVDVSSGVESALGVKDVDKIRAFCQAVRQL